MILPKAPASSNAKQLFRTLKDTRPDRASSLRENIAVLDSDDRNFSTVANQLINNGTADPKWIIRWVYSSGKTYNAIREAKRKSSNCGIDYTGMNFILEDALLMTALDRIGYDDDDETTWLTQAGQGLLLEEAPELRPSLFASVNTIDRYYRALTTAIHIVHPREDFQRFREEAPTFIAWAKDHEELEPVLAAATKAQSLNRSTIEAFIPMIRSTHSAVQDGLL